MKDDTAGGEGESVPATSKQESPLEPWEEEVRRNLSPDCVILGMGNRLKGDDAAGCLVAEGLARRGYYRAFDCGSAPENFLGKTLELNPREVLFVDAVDFGEEPGGVRLFPGGSFGAQSFSTHAAGLGPLVEFISSSCGACCWVLAIQPQSVCPSSPLSERVGEAVEGIVASVSWPVLREPR